MQLDFFFDCSSPWTYLCFEQVIPLAQEFDIGINWKPILVGAIFNAVNPGVEFASAANTMPPCKLDYMLKDMQHWARFTGVDIVFPPKGHPVSSVKAMRACLVLEPQGKLVPFARACFRAYFADQKPISEDWVLQDLCEAVGVDGDWLLAEISRDPVKKALRANVEEAIARGAFGSPTLFLGEDMYFGVDRLPLVRAALQGAA